VGVDVKAGKFSCAGRGHQLRLSNHGTNSGAGTSWTEPITGAGGTCSDADIGGTSLGNGRSGAGSSKVGDIAGWVLADADSVIESVEVDDGGGSEGSEGDGDRDQYSKDMQEWGDRCNSVITSLSGSSSASH
jgi:hypothetical protein